MKRTLIAAGRPACTAWLLDRDLESPAKARKLTLSALTRWGIDPASDTADNCLLCVSETVTNAVTHGRGDVTFTIELIDGAIKISVHDKGPFTPIQRGDDEHGRGLTLIKAYAETVAVTNGKTGKTVTFLMPLEAARRAVA